MPFYTDNTIKAMMALNSSGPRSDPQSIPPYDGSVANNPSGPEPSAPASYTSPRTPLHFHTRGESSIEEGVGVGSRVDRGHGSTVDMTRNLPQERSRFAFVQKWTERINASESQIPAAHLRQSSAGRSRVQAPIKATPATVSRVVGPRPFRSQRVFHARREPILAVPKAVHPLPEWLNHFEDDEEKLSQFRPPSEGSSPSTGVEVHSDRVLKFPPPNMAPPLGPSNPDYTNIDIEVGDWRPKADGHFDKGDEDYPLEFDVDLDFGSDYVSFRSESSTPTSYYCAVNTSDRPTPYQGQIVNGGGYPHVGTDTPLEFPPQGSSTFPLSGPHALPSPLQSSVASASAYNIAGAALIEARADRFLTKMEEGLGSASRPAPGSTLDSFEGDAEGWYDRFNLMDHALPVQQPQGLRVAARFEVPPLYRTATPLPNMGEGGDVKLDAIVISPRSPVF